MNSKELSEKLFKLRPLLEVELGGAREATKWLNGMEVDIKEGRLYVLSSLRAMSFVSKDKKLKTALDDIIEEL